MENETKLKPEDVKDYLTPKDIERILKLSHPTVSKLINLKGFPAVRIGRTIRVKPEDLVKFLDSYKSNKINL